MRARDVITIFTIVTLILLHLSHRIIFEKKLITSGGKKIYKNEIVVYIYESRVI